MLAVKTPGRAAIDTADAAAATLTAAERTYSAGGCPSAPASTDSSTAMSSYLIACDSGENTEYLLGPAALDNTAVANAQASADTVANQWLVMLQFNSTGAHEFQTFTADVGHKPPVGKCGPPRGCNSIGMVLDGTLLSAPSVQQRDGIRGGATQITGDFTKEQAETLAAIAASPPLPSGFTPQR